MFPFTLPGAQFLAFYVIFAALVLWAFWYYLNSGPDLSPPLTELTADPYQIAYIREGADETMRVAVVNLVDRGLLAVEAGRLRVAKSDASGFVRRPLDAAILKRCASAVSPAGVLADRGVRAACDLYYSALAAKGLVQTSAARSTRTGVLVAVCGLLAGVGLARLAQAIARGQTNLVGLIVLTLAALALAYYVYQRTIGPATRAGAKVLFSLKTLLQRLKDRAHRLEPGGATNEALLVAAVFGPYELPFPFVEELFPRPKRSRSDNGNGSGSCGSSCGSGGCGGGGGCGGCGGD